MKNAISLFFIIGFLMFTYTACNQLNDSGSSSSSSGSSGSSNCTTCKMYGTLTGHNGAFGSVTNADATCMADSNYPGTGTYKALIVDGINRIASVSANAGDGQVDWVLHANTTYTRIDGTVIGTTNGNAIFSFPLTNALNSGTYVPWTGLNTDWTSFTNNCINWTSSSNAVNGGAGNKASTTSGAIFAGNASCNATISLWCVEQ